MSRSFEDQTDRDLNGSSAASGQEPGLLDVARLLEREVRGVVYEHLYLAALEARQAGESLVRIIAMGLIAACLLATAWLALVGATVVVMVQNALLTAGAALILVFAVHCLVAMFLVAVIRKHSRSLTFPATISRLDPARSASANKESTR